MISSLRPGAILEVLEAAAVQLPLDAVEREKIALRCPLHDDQTPSAALWPERNVFHCAVCGSLSAKALAARLGVPWRGKTLPAGPPRPSSPPRETPAMFSPAEAGLAWDLSLATHKDDGLAEKNRPVYGYLRARGLAELSDSGEDAYGIAPLDGLPEGCDVWHAKPGRPWGYEIVVPLYSLDGEMVSLQARTTCRAIGDAPRVMTPRGGKGSTVVFASVRGLALLRGERPAGPVLLGEGLTDHLTLTLAAAGRWPVLSTPGASVARSAIDEWARGRTVLVALDQDAAGERAAYEVAERVRAHGGWPRRMRWDEAQKDANDALLAAGLERFMDELLAAIEEVKA